MGRCPGRRQHAEGIAGLLQALLAFPKSRWDRSVLGISNLASPCNLIVIKRAGQTKALLYPASTHQINNHTTTYVGLGGEQSN